MYRLAAAALFAASEALAHEGHGLPGAHLHGWDYLMLAVLVALGVAWVLRNKNR